MASYVRYAVFFTLLSTTALAVSGCATARLNKGAATAKPLTPAERIAQLEKESQAKDHQIAQMQQALEQVRTQSSPVIEAESYYQPVTNVRVGKNSGDLRVPGVSVEQLQRALKAAGYDPGTIDGRLGGKTKDAVRRFQRTEGLKVDGVVGQKTWDALKRQ